ncbi:MAG: TRAFs-binding domain-containing protein [Anaerolineales bacterium]|nr:TRAFs-binding domain-containing protein [Anaerolineales bacterium]
MTDATPSASNTTADANQAKPETKPVEQTPVPAIVSSAESDSDSAQTTLLRAVRPDARPHAFVVMPFGKKKGGDGSLYDFNTIYQTLIKPALEEAGFEPFRADEETASGDILTDMFQELLLADLCLCDLSIDNANVYYELGIRHAFRKRGVVHIQAGRAYMPFDIFNVRTLPYHITPEGTPDPAFIKTDIQAIARMTKDTWASDRDAVHSPIFNLLSGLREPDQRMLRTPLATGFWREYKEWKEKVTVAQRLKRIGNILLLTEEIHNPIIKEEAIGEAGKALASLGRHELALAQYRKGLEVNSGNIAFRRQEAFHLNRIGRSDEAIVKLEGLLSEYPNDSEAISYLGRIYKEMWNVSWMHIKDKSARLKNAFKSYHWLIKAADIYLKGFRIDLNNYYPGVNALTLSMIAVYLADKFDNKKDPDPDIERIRRELPELRGALVFALETKAEDEAVDYWALVSLAELQTLVADNVSSVVRAYRKALTASRRNISDLNSSLHQLEMLKSLGMRGDFVKAGIDTIEEEIARASVEESGKDGKSVKEKTKWKGFLFSGYMADYPGKDMRAFSSDKETQVRQDLSKKLDEIGAQADDRAFLSGLSAGSEIIFAEVCAEKGMHVKVFLPLPEQTYIRKFVSLAGDAWVDRFYKIRSHPMVDDIYQIENVGAPKEGDDPYERNNRWALYSSLKHGVDNICLVAFWDGKSGYSRDRDVRLVNHMIELARDMGARIEQINPNKYISRFIDTALKRLMDEPKRDAPRKTDNPALDKLTSKLQKDEKIDKK